MLFDTCSAKDIPAVKMAFVFPMGGVNVVKTNSDDSPFPSAKADENVVRHTLFFFVLYFFCLFVLVIFAIFEPHG